jgi:hypothetical protein
MITTVKLVGHRQVQAIEYKALYGAHIHMLVMYKTVIGMQETRAILITEHESI